MAKIHESELILNPDGSVYHLNLKPAHLSDTIISVGDPTRVYKVSQHFDKLEFEMNRREFITHIGSYNGKRITVISTGMGTDNIEIFLTELDALANIDLKKREVKEKRRSLKIIRIGTSGALQEDIALGSHLISDYAVGLDTLMCFYDLPATDLEKTVGTEVQEQLGLPFTPYVVQGSTLLRDKIGDGMIMGNTVTCPGFYAPQGRKIRLPLKYPKLMQQLNYYNHNGLWLTNFEMETAGYYALGRILGHEIISANAIIANRIKNRFSKNPGKVVDSLIKKVLERI
ncbi:MAG: nucleoside phosphorylase [Bacteroidota bacterium]